MFRFTKVTWILVLINIAVWLIAGNDHQGQIERWGLLPATFNLALGGNLLAILGTAVTSVTQMFVHEADVFHVGLNMLVVLLFGRAVEKHLGSTRYLAAYLLCGVVAVMFYAINVPDGFHSYGASAAACGIAGAYLILCFDRQFRSCGWKKLLRIAGAACSLVLLALTVRCILDTGNAKLFGFTQWVHLAGYVSGVVLAMMFNPKRRRIAKPHSAAGDPGASAGRVCATVR